MRRNIQNLVTYLIYLGAFIFLLTCLMLATTYIPQKAIQKHMQESAEILAERPTTWQILPGINSSKVHPYADMLTLNIAYHFGDDVRTYDSFSFFDKLQYSNSEKLKAVMWAKYYGAPEDTDESIKLFKQSVDNRLPANKEYLRYWHGSAGIVRLLHIFLNIHQIYILHSIILITLLVYLIMLLLRSCFFREAIALLISLTMVSIWFVPICLEYYWCFLVMAAVSIIAVRVATKGSWQKATILFFFTGIITAFLDFLTTETVTLVIPLLLMVSIGTTTVKRISENDALSDMRDGVTLNLILKTCFSWLSGFSLMWISKWILAALILQEDVLPYVTAHIEERIGGDPNGKSQAAYAIGAVGRNLRCLLPFDYGRFGYFVLGILTGVAVALIAAHSIRINKKSDKQLLLWYSAIGCIPIVRYAVLHNHAWYHRSFTYRALAGSVLALCFIISELFKRRKCLDSADTAQIRGGSENGPAQPYYPYALSERRRKHRLFHRTGSELPVLH